MYGVHIKFDDGSGPFVRFGMTRREYNEQMREYDMKYRLEIEQVEETSSGDRLIFAGAHTEKAKWPKKNREVAKSRARFIERTDGGNGQICRA